MRDFMRGWGWLWLYVAGSVGAGCDDAPITDTGPRDARLADVLSADAGPTDDGVAACRPGELDCIDGRRTRVCGLDGRWLPQSSCPDGAACVERVGGDRCVGACAPGVASCAGRWLLVCDEKGEGYDPVELCDGNCVAGECRAVCRPGNARACRVPGAHGVCADGEAVCDARGELGPCRARQTPTPETCDGADNDCDGATDELPPQACEGVGVGACSAGRRRCEGGTWTACETATRPADEACNGIDDDCDGAVDEGTGGAPCDAAAEGVCRPGTRLCVGGALQCTSHLAPSAETCNTLDDDCDGAIDEGLDLGAPCAEGVGACAVDGVTVCAGDGGTRCSARPAPAAPETCNGVDDDCDGVIDNGLGGPCDSGRPGACAAGEALCVEGESICSPVVDPRPERCDGVDDDCDDAVDEDFPLGQGCQIGEGACAAAGVFICDGRGGLTCDAVPGAPGRERCNAIDDDCDGSVDEDFDLLADVEHCGACDRPCPDHPGNFRLCDAGACVPLCRAGWSDCDADGVCEQFGACQDPCDGADDDNDGMIDEDFVAVECGVGACGARSACTPDGVFEPCVPGSPRADTTCDDHDDDCDGRVDEHYEPIGCGIGACADGARASECRAGVVIPCEEGAPTPDVVCDGVDQDCDGAVDEGYAPASCGVGECISTSRCVAGEEQGCVAEPVADEICNALDDDCDGAVDEGAPVDERGFVIAGAEPIGRIRLDSDDDLVLVAWRSGEDEEVRGQLISTDGALRGAPFQLTEDTDWIRYGFDVALVNDHVAICWHDWRGQDLLRCRVRRPDGMLTQPFSRQARYVSIAGDADGFAAVFSEGRPTWSIVMQRFDFEGRRVGGVQEIAVDDAIQTVPHIAAGHGGWGVVWSRFINDARRDVRFRVVDRDGAGGSETIELGQLAAGNRAHVAPSRDGWLASWRDAGSNDILVERISPRGVARHLIRVSDDGVASQVVDHGGRPLVAWQTAGGALEWRYVDPDGALDASALIPDSMGARGAGMAAIGEAAAIGWHDGEGALRVTVRDGNGLCPGEPDLGCAALPEIGRPCVAGRGGCAREGVWVCAADEAICDAQPGAPQPEAERCDRVDDDCDGITDEGAVDVVVPLEIPNAARKNFSRILPRPGGGWWLVWRNADVEELEVLAYDAAGEIDGEVVRLSEDTVEMRYRFEAEVRTGGLDYCWQEVDRAQPGWAEEVHCGRWTPGAAPRHGSTVDAVYPTIATSGARSLALTAEPHSNVVYARTLVDGVLGDRVEVGHVGNRNSVPQGGWNGHGWGATWRTGSGDAARLYLRLLDDEGRPTTDAIDMGAVGDTNPYSNAVSGAFGSTLVAFRAAGNGRLAAALFDPGGARVWQVNLSDGPAQSIYYPNILRRGDGFEVFWVARLGADDAGEVRSRRVGLDGDRGEVRAWPAVLDGQRASQFHAARAGDDLAFTWVGQADLRATLVRGAQACADAARCAEAVGEGPDPCDGRDDDCDGRVDEGFAPSACVGALCDGLTECIDGVEGCAVPAPDAAGECPAALGCPPGHVAVADRCVPPPSGAPTPYLDDVHVLSADVDVEPADP